MKESKPDSKAGIKPAYLKPIKCNVCHKCWFDLRTNQCIYGGPFIGYIKDNIIMKELNK